MTAEQALASIFGYTIGNDVTERDMQQQRRPVDPRQGLRLLLPDRALDRDRPRPASAWTRPTWQVTCTVDGEPRQDGRTSQLIFDVPTLISYISQVMTLLPGDVVLTGTPAGVGPMRPGQRGRRARSRAWAR